MDSKFHFKRDDKNIPYIAESRNGSTPLNSTKNIDTYCTTEPKEHLQTIVELQ